MLSNLSETLHSQTMWLPEGLENTPFKWKIIQILWPSQNIRNLPEFKCPKLNSNLERSLLYVSFAVKNK